MDETQGEPAPRTRAATEARRHAANEKMANRLRERGWIAFRPERAPAGQYMREESTGKMYRMDAQGIWEEVLNDPFANPGDGTDAGHRPGCSCLSVDIPCKP